MKHEEEQQGTHLFRAKRQEHTVPVEHLAHVDNDADAHTPTLVEHGSSQKLLQ